MTSSESGWPTVSKEGVEALRELTTTTVLLHDDFDPDYPLSDWEGYDTATLLLGGRPDIVCNSLDALGMQYLEWMESINLGARNLLQISTDGTPSTLAERIIESEVQSQRVSDFLRGRSLSVFEARADHEGRLGTKLRTDIVPPVEVFEHVNDKIRGREHLLRCGLPLPDGDVCDSWSNMRLFVAHNRQRGYGTIVKLGHRITFLLMDEGDLSNLKHTNQVQFPILVERFIPHSSSPIVQAVRTQTTTTVLSLADQMHDGLRHSGNSWPVREAMTGMVAGAADAVDDLPPGYGPVGIDFIAGDDWFMAVDLNPRFCSSTYPQVAFNELGFDESFFAITGQIELGPVASLSDVVARTPLIGARRPGILPYSPVRAPNGSLVASFLSVGSTQQQAIDQVAELKVGETA